MKISFKILTVGLILISCMQNKEVDKNMVFTGQDGEIKLTVLSPGHFHASLLQEKAMPQVNDTVFVYAATEDVGLRQYLAAIESFNQREENPTNWQTIVYTGSDFLNKMITDKKGNVVVLAGNNKEKTDYILSAVDAKLNILSDKPMAINLQDFHLLNEAYNNSEIQNVLLYDMMTERYDMLNIIEKELINSHDFFGELQQGTPEKPAVYMESVHHFYKEVSGAPLIRPAWYYDVEQQGEGIADVTTHLIDLLFWKCFPKKPLDFTKDIKNISATHWPTELTLSQFEKSTGEASFPDYLQKDIENSILKVYANGELYFNVNEHHAGFKVLWNYEAPSGGGDTFTSVIKGTKAILKTIQDRKHGFVKQLYGVKPSDMEEEEFIKSLESAIKKIQVKYPFVSFTPISDHAAFLIDIPVENREGHESHFTHVAENFFNYLIDHDLPEWEKSNTLAKYYITTQAVEVAKERD